MDKKTKNDILMSKSTREVFFSITQGSLRGLPPKIEKFYGIFVIFYAGAIAFSLL